MNEKNVKNKQMQYLHQYFSAVHTNQTLAVEDYLEGPFESDDIPVLTLHSQFSRIAIGLIDKSTNETNVLKACFKADELPFLFEQYELAKLEKRNFANMRNARVAESTEASNTAAAQPLPPAYTVTIRLGNFKGKTPARVLLDNPNDLSKLESSRDWLMERVSTHPENKTIIDAINNALELFRSGKLTESGNSQAEPSRTSNKEAGDSPAYTVVLHAGNFKGKTPADVLLADPSKLPELERHKEWLEEHVASYPKNQDAIDAIDDACFLLSTGELKAQKPKPATQNSCVVFDERFKVMSGGSADKKVRCELSVTCEFERNNPWCFRIVNTLVEAVNGKVDNSSRVISRKCATMYLNDSEMARFMYSTRTILRLHEDRVAPAAFDFVSQNQWRPGE